MCGFVDQLVEHHTGSAEVTGSNPVEALIFFSILLSNCLNWKIHCDDHSSLSGLNIINVTKSDHAYRSTGRVAFLVMTSSVYLSRAALPPNPRNVAT